jgi:hypothetical protein
MEIEEYLGDGSDEKTCGKYSHEISKVKLALATVFIARGKSVETSGKVINRNYMYVCADFFCVR